jgi:hypothetical protein
MFRSFDAAKAPEAVDALEAAISKYAGGWADTVARSEIERHLDAIRSVAPRHSLEKIQSFSGWMDILFSQRKQEKYRASSSSGVQMVRNYAFQDLQGIRDQICQSEWATENLSNSE